MMSEKISIAKRSFIHTCTTLVLEGKDLPLTELVKLYEIGISDVAYLDLISAGANQIRDQYMGNHVDLCTILSAKSGKCSEDCKYCAQSAHYSTTCDSYELLNYETILAKAKEVEASGAHRFSLVTSGRSIASEGFIDDWVSIYSRLKQDTNLKLCASHGLATKSELEKLKAAGVSMYHHNVETASERYDFICSTHSYEDRLDTIKNVQAEGLDLCCGGIIGMGESIQERLQMAIEIRALGIKSVPVNVLMPIVGTPMENQTVLSPEEILLTLALYRFALKDVSIRYAGGRMALKHLQQKGFESGVNAALVGNFLTTLGSDVDSDKQMIQNADLNCELI